ncbi:hypothetical protein TPHA_0B03180 [Tetrapisispora phaffii CBS 4417]|uniref:Reverse transcriptase Ty1/copia-type domain-containing protein n=1 Tax=Tetrapisispora phaffii (strain ATCC 24235 / CBS 4417 / NBRC 1672 / NRRL Y-8282 / UCD 70-5) TaxID=1071381 RepID=G8BPQ9_TETPH|nr:hypothetical protein TPHA_0B03180 [Tetrapisispora phaffii CBS 4417]CCE61990.1 hypothetical protein TPHA_0B03180 [Tetrapisispora phaffii CBS 4417]
MLFNQIQSMFNKSIEEQHSWASKSLRTVAKQIIAAERGTYLSDSEKENNMQKVLDHFEALMLIALNPDHQATCLNLLGRNETINSSDVISVISNNVSANNNDVTSSPDNSDSEFRPSQYLRRSIVSSVEPESPALQAQIQQLHSALKAQQEAAALEIERQTSSNTRLMKQIDELKANHTTELNKAKQEFERHIEHIRPHNQRHNHTDESIVGQSLPEVDGVRLVKSRHLNPTESHDRNIRYTQFEAAAGEKLIYLYNTQNGKIISTEDALAQYTEASQSSPPLPPVAVSQQLFPDPPFLRVLPQSFVPATADSPLTTNELMHIQSSSSELDELASSPTSASSHSIHPVLTAVLVAHQSYEAQLPRTINQAMSHPDAAEWKAACIRELSAFRSHETYELVPLPTGRRSLGSRWVFTEKSNGLKKARLVAQGNSQKEGIDYSETFAPVIRYDSVRLFLAMAASLKLRIHQMDVDTAFLNSAIDGEVYVRQPPGFLDSHYPTHVWKLKGGMYGLKQAPFLWNTHINETLLSFGFTRHAGEYGLYFSKSADGLVLVALYVDDLLIAAPSSKAMTPLKELLCSSYSMKDLGPVNKFLGMTIKQSENSISLDLSEYISSAASTSQINVDKAVHTPLSKTTDLFGDTSPLLINITPYQSLIGQLLFAANAGRPDISFAVSTLSRFLESPRQVHFAAAQRLLQYLYTTRYDSLCYKTSHPLSISIYTDASTASKDDLPFSTGGYITTMADGAVTWSSRKIKSTVCLSSTEAECIAGSEAVKESQWLVNFFKFMDLKI